MKKEFYEFLNQKLNERNSLTYCTEWFGLNQKPPTNPPEKKKTVYNGNLFYSQKRKPEKKLFKTRRVCIIITAF